MAAQLSILALLLSSEIAVSWSGQPYNLALLDGRVGTICCSVSASPFWRSLSPEVVGLANGASTSRYNVSVGPPGNYCLIFGANYLSTPSKISCSEPRSGKEMIVHVIVFKTPICKETSTGDMMSLKCFVAFHGEKHWRPYFDCMQISSSESEVYLDGDGLFQTIVDTFSIPRGVGYTPNVCSIKFKKNGEDLGTATNFPELHLSEAGVDIQKDGAEAIALTVVGILFGITLSIMLSE